MLNRQFIKYYCYGYLNTYYCDCLFSFDSSEESFAQHRMRMALRYLGLKDTTKDLSWLSPFMSILEAFSASVIVFFRAIVLLSKHLIIKHQEYQNRTFIASLSFSSFRVNKILDNIRPKEVSTLKIPFIKNEYKENEVDILTGIRKREVLFSLIASWMTIWTLFKKYRKRDPLFRSSSSFDYYLTCCFVENARDNNHFIFYNTYDRWAFLMCNTFESTFIQHGKLLETLPLIKVGTPHVAYYLNREQQLVVDSVLFKSVPAYVKFRKPMSFSCDNLLIHNEKLNVLIVCLGIYINKERELCNILFANYNIYIKPHPGDKDNTEYLQMAKQYNCIIIPKNGYPKVDVVISYDSTLADEYEAANVKVIRYDLLNNLNEVLNKI